MPQCKSAGILLQLYEVLVLHLAAVGILDRPIKHCSELQQFLNPGLQILNFKAEEW